MGGDMYAPQRLTFFTHEIDSDPQLSKRFLIEQGHIRKKKKKGQNGRKSKVPFGPIQTPTF
jgi:hypothetical protein